MPKAILKQLPTRHDNFEVVHLATVVATAVSLGREPQENETTDSESPGGATAKRHHWVSVVPPGLAISFNANPGAYAPGYMLPCLSALGKSQL